MSAELAPIPAIPTEMPAHSLEGRKRQPSIGLAALAAWGVPLKQGALISGAVQDGVSSFNLPDE